MIRVSTPLSWRTVATSVIPATYPQNSTDSIPEPSENVANEHDLDGCITQRLATLQSAMVVPKNLAASEACMRDYGRDSSPVVRYQWSD